MDGRGEQDGNRQLRTTSRLAGLARTAASQKGLVTRAQALQLGCSDGVLRRLCRNGLLERVRRGVYRFTATPEAFEQTALAACLGMAGAVACGVTAMQLYGFDPGRTVREQHRRIEVVAPARKHQPVRRDVVVRYARRLPTPDRGKRQGVPVTSPVRTLLDVAASVPLPTLEQFLGHLLATKALLPSQLRRLADDLRRNRGLFSRFGSAQLRAAIERAGVTTTPDSVLEHRALRLMRQAGVPEPESQWPVNAGGRLQAVLDFAWPGHKVGLEIDGFRWHGDPGAFVRDRRRGNRLQELGWRLFHTTFRDLEEGAPELWRQVRAALGDGKLARTLPYGCRLGRAVNEQVLKAG